MTDPLGPLPPEISRALAALPPPPPPPPMEALLARLECRVAGAPRWTTRRWVPWAAAAAFLLAVGSTFIETRSREGPTGPPISIVSIASDGRTKPIYTERGEPVVLHAGSVLVGEVASRHLIAGRVDAEQDAKARLAVHTEDRYEVQAGTVTFRIPHREDSPVRVRARDVEIVDVGTTFTVEVADAAAPTLVTVAEGAVEANGVRVPAGFGLGFTGKTAGGAPWPLDAKPAVALERGDAPARAGEPVELRLVLSNPTDRWMTLPAPDPLGAPLFVDVARDQDGAAGATTPVRVTPSMGVDFDRLKAGIPPRGRTAVGLRFDTTFASKGTYRLRAVVQPAGTTDQPRSEELVLEVR